LKWIVAHENVKGNERVDKEAKNAAAGLSSPAKHLPHLLWLPLPFSVGIKKTQYMFQLRVEWKE
ncbi:hypothetical protein BYT27DRAFT_7044136, partial [Phlegmacium glaucopus]